MKVIQTHIRMTRGFGLMDVVLGIAIFAFGMLALTELQTRVANSGSDANTRTVASNIAEEMVEERRGFIQIAADAGNGRIDYNEIVSWGSPATVNRGGYDYTVDLEVDDMYWDGDSESFTTTQPTGIVNSDYKALDIVVMWRPLAAGESFSDHDSIDLSEGGGIRMVEAIPSFPGLLGAMVVANQEPLGGVPPVDYSPGENPEVVALTLDGTSGKFKESTKPVPDVMRDEHVETWFDVVTYSQIAGAQANFLRREEFAAVTCDCTLETAPSAADYGLKPTLWNGVDYTEGQKVQKNIGIPVGNAQQSEFCSVCCRDHHDGADSGAEDVYQSSNIGNGIDHAHYIRDASGNVLPTPVGDGDRYLEACRLIRKDGFMRVAQDAIQGVLVGFPEGFLDFAAGVSDYSDYVTGAVSSYYGDPLASLPQPAPYEFPGRRDDDATELPTFLGADNQQLQARAVYTDYLTDAAQDVIDDCLPRIDNGDGTTSPATPGCPVLYLSTELEVYPFFDLQMTKLARWNNESLNGLVAVTNQPIQTGNLHSRGLATLESADPGQSRISITSNDGNLGLTATGPIDPNYTTNLDSIYIDANDGDIAEPPIGTVVSGALRSSLRRVPAADLSLVVQGEAICSQTDTTWACAVAGAATLTVGNYYLNNPQVYVCSDLAYVGESGGTSRATATTTFTLPSSGSGLDIWVTDDFSTCER